MKYFPILLSKAGEFKALHKLDPIITSNISPIIEVLSGSLSRVQTNLINDWSFNGNQVLLDFSSYGQSLSTDINDIKDLFDTLILSGVNVLPVIQQNSPAVLIHLTKHLFVKYNRGICIRASNDGGGLTNYNASISSIMTQIGVTKTNTILLIDLGYAEGHNYNILAALAVNLIKSIPDINQWMEIIVASGSFPVDVSHLSSNTVHRLTRYEWNIWNIINTDPAVKGIAKYGDYGNKNPVYGGDGGYPGSCSIKYTISNEFIIYRGLLARDHVEGNGQYIIFAARLIQTPEYSGAHFSWGDSEIYRIAHEVLTNVNRKPGSATTWVEITQNHHITLIYSIL